MLENFDIGSSVHCKIVRSPLAHTHAVPGALCQKAYLIFVIYGHGKFRRF